MPVARVVNNRYQLVAGERRFRAIKRHSEERKFL
ncbi:ParB N-terminal domain-containing protein [Paenibacillus elgii]